MPAPAKSKAVATVKLNKIEDVKESQRRPRRAMIYYYYVTRTMAKLMRTHSTYLYHTTYQFAQS